MYGAEEAGGGRQWLLALIVAAHLLLGYLILSPSASRGVALHPDAISSGSASRLSLAPAGQGATVRRPSPEAFQLSFDRTALVGPSTRPPPARRASGMHKVAPPFHPS